ncbi:MAG: tripartite tricarboxylate transporter substrate binding protein [Deltaproteobacteria bacterium]|nr:tripartite tricarboxylate transporter substrate binding protein [Deltaproteobacteria bacterium]
MKRMRMQMVVSGAFLLAILLNFAAFSAYAQKEAPQYPTKGVDIIVAWAPGGAADVAARLIAPYASKKWGHPISVINMPGGSGAIGLQRLISAKPDGYTLFMDNHANSPMTGAALPDLPFDWKKRIWIAQIVEDVVFYMVPAGSKWKTLKQMVDDLKQNPKAYKWGCAGPTGIGAFAIAQLFSIADINYKEANMVVFPGGAPTVANLAGGHVDLAAQQVTESRGMLDAGKVRALAVVSPRRLADFPDVPTAKEAGFPRLNIVGWQGVSGPVGLPQYVIDRWVEVSQQAVNDPQFQKDAHKVGKILVFRGPKDFKDHVMKEYEIYKSLVKQMGIVK